MVTCEFGQGYLESTVGILSVHSEAFDGHGGSQVFSIAHVCEPTVAADPPDAYGFSLNNVGGGDDAAGFADL